MQIQTNSARRFLEDFDLILLKESEEAEEQNLQKLAESSSKKVNFITKRLRFLYSQINNVEVSRLEYYKLVDELIELCQKGFLNLGITYHDKVWVQKATGCLVELYDDLVTRIVKIFVDNGKNKVDFDEAKGYAQQLFARLVTGDTPWAIGAFADEPPTQETKAALSDTRVYKRKLEVKKNFDKLIDILQTTDAYPKDIKLASDIFDKEINTFDQWDKQPILSQADWIASMLNYHFQRRCISIKNNIPPTKARRNQVLLEAVYLKGLLTDKDRLQSYITENKEVIEKNYQLYKKHSHRDEKFTLYPKANFTAYIEAYLMRRLIDLYRRKELVEYLLRLDDVLEVGYEQDMFSEVNEIIDNNGLELSTAEQKILKLKYQGFQAVEIAMKLNLTEGRVSQLMKAIRTKAVKKGFSPS